MTDTRRETPYVWPSWLTKLLSREERCWYRAWFQAQYQYEKLPEEDDREAFFREYQEKHDKIVNARAEELRSEGYEVRVEEEGAFKLVGAAGTLAGKPDILAIKGDYALVSDGKAGKRRPSDHWQVLIYKFALPLCGWGDIKTWVGEVVYKDGKVSAPHLGPPQRTLIIDAIKKVMDRNIIPEASPSPQECRYCKIASCQYRYASKEGSAGGLF